MSSGADVCREMAAMKQNSPDFLSTIAGVTNNFSPGGILGGLLGGLGSTAESKSTSITMLESGLTDTSRQEYNKECNNATNYNQQNIIDNTVCIQALGCGAPAPNLAGLSEFASKLTVDMFQKRQDTCQSLLSGGKVVQNNKLDSNQNCAIDGAIKILSQAEMDTNLLATYDKLLESKGLLSKTSNDSNSCNNIKSNITKDRYLKSVQKCYNTLGLNQTNTANCIANAEQTNVASMIQDCLLKEEIIDESKLTSSVAADIKDKITVKAEGLSAGFIMAIVALLVVLLIIGVVIKMSMKKKK